MKFSSNQTCRIKSADPLQSLKRLAARHRAAYQAKYGSATTSVFKIICKGLPERKSIAAGLKRQPFNLPPKMEDTLDTRLLRNVHNLPYTPSLPTVPVPDLSPDLLATQKSLVKWFDPDYSQFKSVQQANRDDFWFPYILSGGSVLGIGGYLYGRKLLPDYYRQQQNR